MATIVLTGASDGIGAAAAVALAGQGYDVVAVGRSQAKLDAVRERMQVARGPESVPEPVAVDLAGMDDVRELAGTLLERCPRIDVVVNNAAIQGRRRETSPDGYEMLLAVNHLAPFLLTNLLIDRVRDCGGRVVTTSSVAHRLGKIDFDDLQLEHQWRAFPAYARSKLANIWFTSELARRTGVPATCYHPGTVDTEILRDTRMLSRAKPVLKWIARTPAKGADTMVWLATEPEGGAPGAVYYTDRRPGRTSQAARDSGAASRLWDVSSRLVGL